MKKLKLIAALFFLIFSLSFGLRLWATDVFMKADSELAYISYSLSLLEQRSTERINELLPYVTPASEASPDKNPELSLLNLSK